VPLWDEEEALTGTLFLEECALIELALLADVEGRDRAVITHHPRPDFAALAVGIVQNDRLFEIVRPGHVVHASSFKLVMRL
jgi:hypothetical protein